MKIKKAKTKKEKKTVGKKKNLGQVADDQKIRNKSTETRAREKKNKQTVNMNFSRKTKFEGRKEK